MLFVRSASGTDRVGRLWRWTPDGGEVELVDPARLLAGADEELSPEERARRERAREAAGGITGYSVDAGSSRVAFALSGRLFLTEVGDAGRTRELAVDGSVIDPRIDPTGRRIAFVAGGRLHVVDAENGSSHAVSPAEPADTVTWGLADFVAAEELDRSRGFWWSPDGTRLLAQRTDEASVPTWFVSNPANPDAPPTPQRYPAAGERNAEVSLWLLDLDGRSRPGRLCPRTPSTSPPSHWSDRGAPVAGVLDRAQRTISWYAVDVTTGVDPTGPCRLRRCVGGRQCPAPAAGTTTVGWSPSRCATTTTPSARTGCGCLQTACRCERSSV